LQIFLPLFEHWTVISLTLQIAAGKILNCSAVSNSYLIIATDAGAGASADSWSLVARKKPEADCCK